MSEARKPTRLASGWRRTLGETRESVWMAVDAIIAHKLRSALTLVGVLVGVFSIIVVMTAMRVMRNNAERELSQLGSHTFQIQKWPAVMFDGPGGWEKYWRRKNITLEHGLAVRDRSALALSVGIEARFWGGTAISRYEKTPPTVRMLGATPGSFPAHSWTLADGRPLIETDIESARPVCVLGDGLAKMLFPFGSAVGDRIQLDGIYYSVIGVLEARGATLGGDQDNFAIIPLTTGLDRYGRIWRTLSILVQARGPETYEDTIEEVRGILRVARRVEPGKEDDFEVFSNDSLIAQFENITRAVRAGVAIVSSIALLAAGVGIMNIMLVSVTERTREIGIRRALGARKRNILVQFLIEAVVLCEIGGVIGVVLGILGGNAAAFFLKVPPVVPVDWIFLGLFLCSLVGVIFGTYPAWKAANLDPIESLRYE